MNYAVWELRSCELFSLFCMNILLWQGETIAAILQMEQRGSEEFCKAKMALRVFMVSETN